MRHRVTCAPTWLAVGGLIATFAACGPREAGDAASKDSPAAATAGGDVAKTAKIPITSASEEARTLYTQGRDLAEQLRAHDGRQLFTQAVAKDSTFALAHYNLALNSATAKEFFQHLNQDRKSVV